MFVQLIQVMVRSISQKEEREKLTDKYMKCVKFYKQNLRETKELQFRDNTLQKPFVQNFFLLFICYLSKYVGNFSPVCNRT